MLCLVYLCFICNCVFDIISSLYFKNFLFQYISNLFLNLQLSTVLQKATNTQCIKLSTKLNIIPGKISNKFKEMSVSITMK